MTTRTMTVLSIAVVLIAIALVLLFFPAAGDRVWQVLGEPLSTAR